MLGKVLASFEDILLVSLPLFLSFANVANFKNLLFRCFTRTSDVNDFIYDEVKLS